MLTALENGVKGGVWYSLIDNTQPLRRILRRRNDVSITGGGRMRSLRHMGSSL
jgi:hypothetical protein